MPSPIVSFQISSADPEASQAFYDELFDWDFGEAGPDGGISIDPQGPADFDAKGSLTAARGDASPGVTLFVRVSDLPKTFERAESLEAEVIVPITQIDGGAHLAIIRAPDGMVLGIIQA
ncbi:MAG TPA: VOC family protein [Dehalococcoidia bacterium]|nr:VOC family protein [Dehalococcoidia bacterium]